MQQSAHVIGEGFAVGMCRAVVERGRAERQRCRWNKPGRFQLNVLQSGRFDFAISRRTEQLLKAAEHERLFGRRQTLIFPAPTKMLQRGRVIAYPPAAWGPDGSSFSLEQRRPNNFEGRADARN